MKIATPAQARKQRGHDQRRYLADYIADLLRKAPCCQPAEGWTPATVTDSFTTSDCPLITLTFADGLAFNVTVTVARP